MTPRYLDILKNFRPISNLPFLPKILEKVVLGQLQQHLSDNKLLESAYRKEHSVETAVLSVMDNLLTKNDEKFVTLISLLDLGAAFDTLDHSIILRRLEVSFGVKGNVPAWFTSYVSGRFQSVTVAGNMSTRVPFCTESHRALYLGRFCLRYIHNRSLNLKLSIIWCA